MGSIEKVDELVNNLAEAGVEIKLTRTEIADYIAAKAEELLDKEYKELSQEMARLADIAGSGSKPLNTVPKILKDVMKHLKAIAPEDPNFKIYFRPNTWTPHSYHISGGDGAHGTVRRVSLVVDVPENEVPPELAMYHEVNQRRGEVYRKQEELKSKKYKTIMIEKILGGTGKGKKLLENLDTLAKHMVQS